MCLRTKNLTNKFKRLGLRITLAKAKELVIKTASRDKIVYKRFYVYEDKLRTPFQSFTWPKGTIDVPRLGVRMEFSRLRVDQGLHAYTTLEMARKRRNIGETVRRMVIPRGAQYVIGDYDEIVATAMRLATREEIDGPKRKPAKAGKRKLASKRKKK